MFLFIIKRRRERLSQWLNGYVLSFYVTTQHVWLTCCNKKNTRDTKLAMIPFCLSPSLVLCNHVFFCRRLFSFFPVYIHVHPPSLGSMVSQYLFYQANMLCFQALAPICPMGTGGNISFNGTSCNSFFPFFCSCVCRHNPVAPATTVSAIQRRHSKQ